MPDVTANSHQPPEDRFLSWVDALVDPAEAIPVPDADLAEVAGTAAFVQRVAGPGSAPSLSTDRTESIWEEIMRAAPNSGTPNPTLPASTGARSIASRALPAPPNAGWRTWLPTALLIAAIVVAGGVAAWRIAGPFDLAPGGNGPKTAHQPGIAASATPAASADGCPLSSDIPFFPAGAPKGAADLGTTYAVVEDGNFTIRCSEVEDPGPLMNGVTNATPLPWPGTVLLELDSGEVLAYNFATGERTGLSDFQIAANSVTSTLESPWLLVSVGPDVHFVNLRTMHKTDLAVISGGKLPEGYAPVVVSSPGSSVAVITDPAASPSPAGEMPGTALVIDETLESRRWIDVQGQVTVDDGVIAYETEFDGQPVLRVQDAETGEAVFDVGPVDVFGTFGQRFALSGETLVYIHDWRLWTANYRELSDFNPSIQVVDADGRHPGAVYPTGVPGRVLIEWDSEENIGGPSEPGAKSVSILDVATGKLTDVAGLVPIDPDAPARFARARYLVSVGSASDSDDQVVARMVDIATGETVLTSEPIENSVRELIEANNVLGASRTGAVVTISTQGGSPVLLDATNGIARPVTAEALPSSGDQGEIAWHIVPSSDGTLLFAIGRPQPEGNSGVDITSPNALPGAFAVAPVSSELAWSEPVDILPAGVIPGIPAGDSSDEPAVMEAQEFSTPAPAATPASLVAETAGCDLTGDIPVVTGPEPELSGTVLRLVDGTLTMDCDDEEHVVAEGVAEVVPGSTWPGAVLLRMGDGSLRGINLLTGAEGDLGSYPDQGQLAHGRTSRWIFFPTSPEQLDWRIVDLETMDSLLLSDALGGVLPRSTVAHLWSTTPEAAVIGFGGIPVLRPGTGSLDDGATPAAGTPVAGLPAEWSALVIDGSLDNRRWIETSRPMFTSAWISPDSGLLAYPMPVDDGFTVRVERLSDGALVADTGIALGGGDAFLVTSDALMHLVPDRLDRVSWDDAGEVTVETLVAFDEPRQNPVLRQTADPNIAVAWVGTPGPSGGSAGYLIDVGYGRATEVPGMMQMPLVMTQYDDGAPIGYVLAAVPASDPAQSVVQLIDVSSGKPVASSAPIDVGPADLAGQPAAQRGDRGFVFLPDGRTIVLDAASGEAFVIEPPGNRSLTYQMPGPGGDLLVAATGNAVLVREVAPDSEWIEVSPASQLWFLPGSERLRR